MHSAFFMPPGDFDRAHPGICGVAADWRRRAEKLAAALRTWESGAGKKNGTA
ncbi:MAG: hypothetical protein IIZ83_10270 [Oscillospiraceae bacterium]|nr:hypothetical protein [Oscillospiraceae bacterium]